MNTASAANKRRANRQLFSSAKDLVDSARKVVNYRRHLLGNDIVSEIETEAIALKCSIKSRDCSRTKMLSQSLYEILEKHGGDVFPIRFCNDNTEVFFVAVLLAIAVRTFFVQSFQIPTNSMYPTYHGMTHRIIRSDEHVALWRKVSNKIQNGSKEINVLARNSGEISVPLVVSKTPGGTDVDFIVNYDTVAIKKWCGLKTAVARKYTLFVGNRPHEILVPIDFPLDKVLLGKFCGNSESWRGAIDDNSYSIDRDKNILLFRTGHTVNAGDSVLHFEILAGDMLFVDRMTYHFREPAVGESVVFRSDEICNFHSAPKFLIKRLVGKAGDTLKIDNNKLFINDALNSPNEIMKELNAKSGEYSNGYQAAGMLGKGKTVSVPMGKYFMLGDNSYNSYDSRFWEFAPQKSVCGRPLLIFYPFNGRFGRCK
jgi:signal peptidase I